MTTQPFFGNLTFNEPDVSIVEFVFSRDDGGPAASYLVSNLTYTVSAVPELSTWAMLLLGFLSIRFLLNRGAGAMPMSRKLDNLHAPNSIGGRCLLN